MTTVEQPYARRWMEIIAFAHDQAPFTPPVVEALLTLIETNGWLPITEMRGRAKDPWKPYDRSRALAMSAKQGWVEARATSEPGFSAAVTSAARGNTFRSVLMPAVFDTKGTPAVEHYLARGLAAFPLAQAASANCDFDQMMFKRDNGLVTLPLFGPNMGWLHVLSANAYPSHYDREVLLAAPCYRVEERADHSIWIWLYEHPMHFDTQEARATHIAFNRYLQQHVRR